MTESRTHQLRTDVAHSARIYDFFLDGKDNYPADREAAQAVLAVEPSARLMARANRAFMGRATRFLAEEVGIRQFLDVGTGIPTSPNLHETAQHIAPESRIVYVDNDPIVLVHARALLTSTPQGRTAYLEADLRDPASILNAPELRDTLDLTRPIALSLNAILHFIPDDGDPAGIVRELVAALPAGSHLVLSHITADLNPAVVEKVTARYQAAGISLTPRTADQITALVTAAGAIPVDPGLVPIALWRPAEEPTPQQRALWLLGTVSARS